MKKLSAGLLVSLVASGLIACGAVDSHRKTGGLESELDALVPRLLSEHGVPGASVAVIGSGRLVLSKGYGFADKVKRTPVTPETRFNIGSVSKALTACAVMTLVDGGLINLDAPVDAHLKRWRLPESRFDNNKVTIRRLLNHTAGLSVYPMGATINGHLPGGEMGTLVEALSRSYEGYGKPRLIEEPGRFQYNNGNYVVLQLLIEDVTGEAFATYIQRSVFEPLGMTNSGYQWTPELQASVATPHNPDGKAWPHYQYVEQASGGAYTTGSDLARFVAALASAEGHPVGRGVLKPETAQLMITPAEGTEGRYGLGYKMFPVSEKVRLVSHDGANEGWRAMFMMHSDSGDGMVLLTNSDVGGKIAAPIICSVFAGTKVDMTPLCPQLSR